MLFPTFQTASSGLGVFRTWMDAVSDNMANLNTVRPTSESAFQARFVVATAIGSGQEAMTGGPAGATVSGISLGDPAGRLVHDPSNPLADADGMVRYPDIDMGDQMTQLMIAQRGYEANLSVIDRAKDAYQQALSIGRG
ncbi:MAG TPA: flagellar basal body rod C-terminal domain-containing protein [Acidimicrobiia bacterium]|jgi:flagellar basal-body rod protein FlgC|nr:flagellar basal body rod C-terminal domain-containing protein [Acidimicrobiia bacterium]